MAQPKLPIRPATTSLLSRVLDDPHLPADIQLLPSRDLHHLVNCLGKQDAQALLTHATTQQIIELIEADVWTITRPGVQERFSSALFLEWLELWSESGPDMLTRRLKDLGGELFALTIHEYAIVVNIFEVGVSGAADTFGDFAIMPTNDDVWPLLFDYITQVWDEDPDFMESVFGHCCLRRSLTVEKTHITGNENLALDVEENRELHRRNSGYATRSSSDAFLARIRQSTLEDLILESRYDDFSAMQLRILAQHARETEVKRAQASDISSMPPVEKTAHYSVVDLLNDLPTPAESDSAGPASNLQLLPSTHSTTSYLQQQLQRLARENMAMAQLRQREIAYLSNILKEGVLIGGSAPDSKAAMLATSNTINLGLTYCIFSDPWLTEEEHLVEFLENEPGLIKAFNIGYCLLLTLAGRAEQTLITALAHKSLGRYRKSDPDWGKELDHWLTRYQSQRQANRSGHYALSQLTDLLSLYGNPATCVELAIIADDFPRYPGSLLPDSEPGIRVDRSAHFISTVDELKLLTNFLANMTLD